MRRQSTYNLTNYVIRTKASCIHGCIKRLNYNSARQIFLPQSQSLLFFQCFFNRFCFTLNNIRKILFSLSLLQRLFIFVSFTLVLLCRFSTYSDVFLIYLPYACLLYSANFCLYMFRLIQYLESLSMYPRIHLKNYNLNIKMM